MTSTELPYPVRIGQHDIGVCVHERTANAVIKAAREAVDRLDMADMSTITRWSSRVPGSWWNDNGEPLSVVGVIAVWIAAQLDTDGSGLLDAVRVAAPTTGFA